jgi:hypothetical protein
LLGLLLAVAALAGCSSGRRVGVEGEVTYAGEPLGVGTITFLPEGDKGVKCGGRIENGRYKVEPQFGPTPGPHRVEIRWAKPTGKKYKNEFGEVFDVTAEGLPDKYHGQTVLRADVNSGSNKIDFHLDR